MVTNIDDCCPNCGEVLCDRVVCMEDGDEVEHFARLHRANDAEDREADDLVARWLEEAGIN